MEKTNFPLAAEGETAYEVRRDNTKIIRYFGEQAIYDHIRVQVDEDTTQYIWKNTLDYFRLISFVENNGFEEISILRDESEEKIKSYKKIAKAQLFNNGVLFLDEEEKQ